jgi:hypothetical protein
MVLENPIQLLIDKAIITDSNDPANRHLDPAMLLDQLHPDIKSVLDHCNIEFKQDVISTKMSVSTFLAKTYQLEGNFLRINYRKLDLADTSATLFISLSLSI